MSNLVIQLFSFIVQTFLLIFLAVLRLKLSLWPMVPLHSYEPLGVVTNRQRVGEDKLTFGTFTLRSSETTWSASWHTTVWTSWCCMTGSPWSDSFYYALCCCDGLNPSETRSQMKPSFIINWFGQEFFHSDTELGF